VVSTITLVTALGARRKPLKARAIELERETAGSDVETSGGETAGEIRNGFASRDKPLKEKP